MMMMTAVAAEVEEETVVLVVDNIVEVYKALHAWIQWNLPSKMKPKKQKKQKKKLLSTLLND